MDKVEKIRNEIERLHGNPYYMMAIKDVLSIIDSPQEENSFDAHIQEGDNVTVNENGSRFNRSQLERVIVKQKQPISEELDVLIKDLQEHYRCTEYYPATFYASDMEFVVRHVAEWQHKQDESLLQDHVAYKKGKEYGYNKCRREIMKLSVERTVKVDAGGYPFIEATELYDYDNDKPLAKAGDRVKVVFIKDK